MAKQNAESDKGKSEQSDADNESKIQARELARLRAYFAGTASGIFVYSPNGELLDVNPAACAMHGYSREEMLAMRPEQFIAPESLHVFHAFRNTVIQGDAFHGEARGLRRDGSKIDVEMEGRLINVDGEQLLFSSLTDVSDKNLLADQLRHSQRMESLGRMAGGIAHDFNNLLSVIMGYTEALMADAGGQDSTELNSIFTASERARDLVKRLLAFSRRQTLLVEPTLLSDYVAEQTSMLRRVLPESITITTDIDSDEQPVMIDAAQMEQVIINLAINAQQAMPQGGTLTISTARLDPRELTAMQLPSSDFMVLSVADSGVGMDSDQLPKIFEPFYTTKDPGQGSGLGLAMVYGSVRQHGGHVDVTSEPGSGTTFDIYLPVTESRVVKPQAEDHCPIIDPGSGLVLVVEDDPGVLKLSVDALEKFGYRVFSASGAAQALQLMREEGPFDVLLSDIIMPDMNGRQLFEQLKQLQPDLKVVFMSGYPQDVLSEQGLVYKEYRLLHKPFRFKELDHALRQVLSDSQIESTLSEE